MDGGGDLKKMVINVQKYYLYIFFKNSVSESIKNSH